MAKIANTLQLRGQLSAVQYKERRKILYTFIFDMFISGDKLSEGVFCFFTCVIS